MAVLRSFWDPSTWGAPAFDIDYTTLLAPAAGNTDLGVAAGAKTIAGNANYELINSAAYLAADPNGLYISDVAGEGIIMKTSAVPSLSDFNGSLGPALSIQLVDLMGAAVWPPVNTSIAAKFEYIVVGFIFDASDCDTNDQSICLGVDAAKTSYGRGGSMRAGWGSGAESIGGNRQVAAYQANDTTLANYGRAALPTQCFIKVTPENIGVLVGDASGNTYGTSWDGWEEHQSIGHLAQPSGTGSILAATTSIFFGAEDSTGVGVTLNLKRATVWLLNTQEVLPVGGFSTTTVNT